MNPLITGLGLAAVLVGLFTGGDNAKIRNNGNRGKRGRTRRKPRENDSAGNRRNSQLTGDNDNANTQSNLTDNARTDHVRAGQSGDGGGGESNTVARNRETESVTGADNVNQDNSTSGDGNGGDDVHVEHAENAQRGTESTDSTDRPAQGVNDVNQDNSASGDGDNGDNVPDESGAAN